MADVWTSMLLSPGTILYVAAPTDETISIIEQILPMGPLLALLSMLGAAPPSGVKVQPAGEFHDRTRPYNRRIG
jgi:hypothetical protein